MAGSERDLLHASRTSLGLQRTQQGAANTFATPSSVDRYSVDACAGLLGVGQDAADHVAFVFGGEHQVGIRWEAAPEEAWAAPRPGPVVELLSHQPFEDGELLEVGDRAYANSTIDHEDSFAGLDADFCTGAALGARGYSSLRTEDGAVGGSVDFEKRERGGEVGGEP
jgi:hypothetical protein